MLEWTGDHTRAGRVRSPLPRVQLLAPVYIQMHQNEKGSFSVAPATFKCPLTPTTELLATLMGSSERQQFHYGRKFHGAVLV